MHVVSQLLLRYLEKGIINAMGQSVPPVSIISRKRSNPAFVRGTCMAAKPSYSPVDG